MKKTVLLIFTMLVVTTSVSAQITAAEMPSIGDTIVYRLINKNTFDPQPSNTGLNVIWNYSSVVLKSDTVQLFYIDPADTPEDTLFPNSGVAEATGGTTGHFFFKLNANEFLRTGFYTDELQMVYTDTLKLCELPFQFGTSYNDDYTGTGVFPVLGTPYPAMIDDGEFEFDVDGTGTLILPHGAFNNVYRVYYEEFFTIKADLGLGGYMGIASIDEYGYEWWKAGHVKPLLTYYHTETTDMIQGGTQTDEVVRFDKYALPDGPVPGFGELSDISGAVVFYNAAEQKIHIQYGNDVVEKIMLHDVTGRLLLDKTVNGNEDVISTSGLATGAYFLLIQGKNSVFSKKIIIY